MTSELRYAKIRHRRRVTLVPRFNSVANKVKNEFITSIERNARGRNFFIIGDASNSSLFIGLLGAIVSRNRFISADYTRSREELYCLFARRFFVCHTYRSSQFPAARNLRQKEMEESSRASEATKGRSKLHCDKARWSERPLPAGVRGITGDLPNMIYAPI